MKINTLETKEILKTLTLRKILNYLKIFLSFYVSKYTKKNYHWGMPASIGFEPTNYCNLRCPECPSGLRSFTRPTGNSNIETFQKLIDSTHKNAIYLLLYFQGEPYLNPHFFDMVKYATHKKLFTATSTNAHFLNDENAKKTIQSGLKRLIISLDGTTQATYESYRIGGNLEKVLEGTKNLVKWKKKLNSKTPILIFQFLVVKHNEHQIEDAKKLAKEIGVNDIWFKTAQIYDFKNGNPLIPDNQRFSRYKKLPNGKYEIKNKLKNQCWRLWQGTELTWDGKVLPCCFDKDALYEMGSIENSDFQEIWDNSKYKNFRKQILKSRSSIDICRNCTEGTKIFD